MSQQSVLVRKTSYHPKRWPEELTCKFVEKYVELELLWNQRHNLYKDMAARYGAIEQLQEHINIDGFQANDVKNKIRSLRATWMGEYQKIASKAQEGILHETTMRWYGLMTPAMQECVEKKYDMLRPETLLEIQSTPSASQTIKYDSNDEDEDYNKYFEVQKEIEVTDHISSSSEHLEMEDHSYKVNMAATPKGKVKRRKRTNNEPMTTTVSDCDQEKDENAARECELFAKYLTSQLQQVSSENRIMLQQEILNLVSQTRINEMKKAKEKNDPLQ